MKKISKFLSLILSVIMIASLFGCAKQEAAAPETEAVTEAVKEVSKETEAEEPAAEEIVYADSIPLGGNCGDLLLDSAAYGEYVEIPGISYESVESHQYYCEDCAIQYISIYRWAKNGKTLEEAAAESSKKYGDGYYVMVDASDWGYAPEGRAAYFYKGSYKNDKYYYGANEIFEDGDEFVEIVYTYATEEVALGDSGAYIYVPTGYENMSTKEDAAKGLLFQGEYEKDYYVPNIWLTKFDPSYEWLSWWWDDIYPDGIPYTEADFDADHKNITANSEDTRFGAYEKLGAELTYVYSTTVDGVNAEICSFNLPAEGTRNSEIFFAVGDEIYVVWTETADEEFHPYLGKALINSLHRKSGTLNISLGGNCGDIELEGIAYGTYKEIPAEGWFVWDGAKDTHVYEDTSCDTPYVATYRVAKNGKTLEEFADEEKDIFNAERYEKFSSEGYDHVPGDEMAFICGRTEMDDEFYYIESSCFEDGEDFIEIVWFCKSTEIALGDTGKKAWVPAGYTNHMSDDDAAHGSILEASYDDSYFMPAFWVGVVPEKSYEYQTWFWEDYYPEGLPFTEEEYKALDEMDIDAAYEAYYKYFGYEVLHTNELDQDGIKGYVYVLKSDVETNEADVTLFINGQCVKFWTVTEASDDAPYIARTFVDSIH